MATLPRKGDRITYAYTSTYTYVHGGGGSTVETRTGRIVRRNGTTLHMDYDSPNGYICYDRTDLSHVLTVNGERYPLY